MQTFPKWTNKLPGLLAAGGGLGSVAAIFLVWYYFSPRFTDVGYQPKQPVPYSHKLHAGDLGMDCRYCHAGVEQSNWAPVPTTQICMNCHKYVKTDSQALAPIRESWAKDQPMEWVRIHKVPDFAFFNHSAHLAAGVGCSTCHGRIDQMVKVKQDQPLSMGWCLDCHRDPYPNIRHQDELTKMDWQPPPIEQQLNDPQIRHDLNPPQNCSGCHR